MYNLATVLSMSKTVAVYIVCIWITRYTNLLVSITSHNKLIVRTQFLHKQIRLQTITCQLKLVKMGTSLLCWLIMSPAIWTGFIAPMSNR